MKGRAILALALALALSGCARPGDQVLTPVEREQMLRSAQAARLRRETRPVRCGAASEIAQLEARHRISSGADGFDARGCPRGITNPTVPGQR